MCSDRGECLCGQCICNLNHEGKFCECDLCPRWSTKPLDLFVELKFNFYSFAVTTEWNALEMVFAIAVSLQHFFNYTLVHSNRCFRSAKKVSASACQNSAGKLASAPTWKLIAWRPTAVKFARATALASVTNVNVIRHISGSFVRVLQGTKAWTRCASFMSHVFNVWSTESLSGNVPITKRGAHRRVEIYTDPSFTMIFLVRKNEKWKLKTYFMLAA